ncbi:MAG: N-acetyl-gamma-glutamyl-phosphate reductase [Bacteroidales bacterium]|nr:N-acetyl-gamma-glutamyl-phosphate reductase [Bacteroidales bacterium]
MIKAGIIGGSNPMAGELIRLLINHPDVEIMWVDSARYVGRLVSDVHHGLIGECELRISPSSANRLEDIDALFIFRHKGQTLDWLSHHELPEDLRIIDLSVDMREPENARQYDFVYGLPELNRKAMVRGAKRAVVPHPAALIAELTMLPMAKEGALANPIHVNVSMPERAEQIDSTAEVTQEIVNALRELQADFDQPIVLVAGPADDDRALMATVEFDTDLDIGEILRLYEEFYEDHNFTFIINQAPEAKEVAGTNKCLMRIDKRDGHVRISAMLDALIKGASGTAVHDMNLLFGLHERVGLALKASTY